MESIVNDPSLNGWATFFVYLGTAALCAVNAHRSQALADGIVRHLAQAQGRRRFWLVMAGLMALLGLTRLLDLQILAADLMRAVLRDEGAYGDRAGLQLGLIIVIGSFGMIGLIISWLGLRRAEGSALVAMGGAALLATFTAIRTISLHGVDEILKQSLGLPHFQVNNLIEIGLLGWIVIASYAFFRNLQQEGASARLRAIKIQERRRQLSEKRRLSQS